MADPFAALAPELRALGGGATPEEIQGVLAYLLTQEGVQAGLEPLAETLVEQGGYGSLVALAKSCLREDPSLQLIGLRQ